MKNEVRIFVQYYFEILSDHVFVIFQAGIYKMFFQRFRIKMCDNQYDIFKICKI